MNWEHRGRIGEFTLRTTAAPAAMWAAWADPRHLCGWFPDRAEGSAQVGAKFTYHFDDYGMHFDQEVVEMEPERRFVLLYQDAKLYRVLEVLIRPEGSGSRLRVLNSGLPEDDDGFLSIESGWKISLELLRLYLEKYFGRARHSVQVFRETRRLDSGKLLALYSERDARQNWLRMDHEPLVVTAREAVLEWPEVEGALELKGFPTSREGRTYGLRASSWAVPETLTSRRLELESAVERLQALLS